LSISALAPEASNRPRTGFEIGLCEQGRMES
jgi:hypothetical protein